MPCFRLSQILLFTACLPVGVGFWPGVVDLSDWLLDTLVGNRGWVRAVDAFTTSHFGGHADGSYSWTTAFISFAPAVFAISIICSVLAAFEIPAAGAFAWILIASAPLSRALSNYLLVGAAPLYLDTYVVPFSATAISATGWFLVRRTTMRSRAIASDHFGYGKENLYLGVFIVLAVAVCALGWSSIRSL